MRLLLALLSSIVLALGSAAQAEGAEPAELPPVVGQPTFNEGARLVFLGDSITDMKWGRNEKDRNHYLGHSFVFLLAARMGVEQPKAGMEFFNRGISGHTVAQLRARWQKDAIDMKPDVLTVLIGTNDVARGVKPEDFERDYRHILQASREANPELRIVLMSPFVLRCGPLAGEAAWKDRRARTDEMGRITEKLAREFDAVHVPLQQVFDAAAAQVSPDHWIWDGIHPLPQGHELIAREWIRRTAGRWRAR